MVRVSGRYKDFAPKYKQVILTHEEFNSAYDSPGIPRVSQRAGHGTVRAGHGTVTVEGPGKGEHMDPIQIRTATVAALVDGMNFMLTG